MDAWTALAVSVCSIALLLVALRRLRSRSGRAGASGGALRTYLRRFDAKGVPDDVSLAIHHHLQKWMSDTAGSFPVRPEDSLAHVYGVAPDEVADALRLLVRECGRRWPDGAETAGVTTVEDLVLFVAGCPPLDDADRAPSGGAAES